MISRPVVADTSGRQLEGVNEHFSVFVDRQKLLSPEKLFAHGSALAVRRVHVVGAGNVGLGTQSNLKEYFVNFN